MHAFLCLYVYIYIYIYICVCKNKNTRMCSTHTNMHMHAHRITVNNFGLNYVCMYVCMYMDTMLPAVYQHVVYINTHTHTCIHRYTNTHNTHTIPCMHTYIQHTYTYISSCIHTHPHISKHNPRAPFGWTWWNTGSNPSLPEDFNDYFFNLMRTLRLYDDADARPGCLTWPSFLQGNTYVCMYVCMYPCVCVHI